MTPTTHLNSDAVLVDAVEDARRALESEIAPAAVGPHLEARTEGERVVTHLFDSRLAGYAGWRWAVTVTSAVERAEITVDEIVLIPGPDAITAPPWVPYKDRIKPGDLSPGDLLPLEEDDPRVVPTYLVGDDGIDPLSSQDIAQIRQVADDLGLGRVRTLSIEGINDAAQRWYDGDGGPDAPIAQSAPDHCYNCAFLVRLAGPLSQTFGVCANGSANDDGRVVTFNHGCGAHSEAQLTKKQKPIPLPDHVFDTVALDDFESF
ncbi:MAG TPA: DUF3027 domain-containing protein [Nocardioides sp.]